MLETFTPAVCGSRKRQVLAQIIFSVTAVATSVALGLALGLAGSALGARRALLAAAALALVAAAREAGLLHIPLPQARRQVPERWRFEQPLPVWASGYGAGLGAGFFTFQPVSTFWVACAGALALARPLPAALCLSLYGAGRAAMVIWPRRAGDDPTAAVERLTSRRGTLLRANAVALAACAVLLAVAPAAGGATFVAGRALDPSASGRALAFATQGGDVVVKPPSGPDEVFSNASQPALSGGYLAYVDSQGIRVVRWRDRSEVARIDNTNVSRPALDWPTLAFVRREASGLRLVVRNLVTGATKMPMKVALNTDLGRPSLRSGRVAWHVVTRTSSRDPRQRPRERASSRDRPDEDRQTDEPVPPRDARDLGGRPLRGHVPAPGMGALDQAAGARDDQEPGGQLLDDEPLRRSAYMTRWTVATGAAGIYKTPT